MLGHPLLPPLCQCATQDSYHNLNYKIKPCCCVLMCLCRWWSSWGLRNQNTTLGGSARIRGDS